MRKLAKEKPIKSRASIIIEEIFKNAKEHLKKDFKILILGGTGQGKTSFLNFLFNAEKAINDQYGIQTCKDVNDKSVENGSKNASHS